MYNEIRIKEDDMEKRYVVCSECGAHGLTARIACECGRPFTSRDMAARPAEVTLFGLLPAVAA